MKIIYNILASMHTSSYIMYVLRAKMVMGKDTSTKMRRKIRYFSGTFAVRE